MRILGYFFAFIVQFLRLDDEQFTYFSSSHPCYKNCRAFLWALGCHGAGTELKCRNKGKTSDTTYTRILYSGQMLQTVNNTANDNTNCFSNDELLYVTPQWQKQIQFSCVLKCMSNYRARYGLKPQ